VRAGFSLTSASPVRLCVAAMPNTYLAGQDAAAVAALTTTNTGNNAYFLDSATVAAGTFSFQTANPPAVRLTPGSPYKLYAVAFEAEAFAADSLTRAVSRADYVTSIAFPFSACNLPEWTSLTVTVAQYPDTNAIYALVRGELMSDAGMQTHAWLQETTSPTTFSAADYLPSVPLTRADFAALRDEQRVSVSSAGAL
jgi:hypothetical protein